MADEEKKPESGGESGGETKPKKRAGGWIFPAIILLVVGGVCVKDGFWPPKDWERWKVVFNQVIAVGGIVVGLGLLVYELLQPRSKPEDETTDGKETKK